MLWQFVKLSFWLIAFLFVSNLIKRLDERGAVPDVPVESVPASRALAASAAAESKTGAP